MQRVIAPRFRAGDILAIRRFFVQRTLNVSCRIVSYRATFNEPSVRHNRMQSALNYSSDNKDRTERSRKLTQRCDERRRTDKRAAAAAAAAARGAGGVRTWNSSEVDVLTLSRQKTTKATMLPTQPSTQTDPPSTAYMMKL